MDQSTREILKNQLSVLSKYSTKELDPRELRELTGEMCRIASLLEEPVVPLPPDIMPQRNSLKSEILQRVKEVKQTSDSMECVMLLQSGCWIVHNALIQGEKIVWCLLRF